jgi:CRISPR/Cas system endoribonuclease Cas6 (RAMP superfamily)
MEFYSAMKKNEILSLAGKWKELENIILSEISQAQKTKIFISLSPLFVIIFSSSTIMRILEPQLGLYFF